MSSCLPDYNDDVKYNNSSVINETVPTSNLNGKKRKKEKVTQKQVRNSCGEKCTVCDKDASGLHFGAFICEACKKFFMRSIKKDGGLYRCIQGGQCKVNEQTRSHCPSCRLQKCYDVGLVKDFGKSESGEAGNIWTQVTVIPCKVCGAQSSGFHFGAFTCEGCKSFFRRLYKNETWRKHRCMGNDSCDVTVVTRNSCKSCRYSKCLGVGMSASASRIGRHTNAVKYATLFKGKAHEMNVKTEFSHCAGILNVTPTRIDNLNDATTSGEFFVRNNNIANEMGEDMIETSYNDGRKCECITNEVSLSESIAIGTDTQSAMTDRVASPGSNIDKTSGIIPAVSRELSVKKVKTDVKVKKSQKRKFEKKPIADLVPTDSVSERDEVEPYRGTEAGSQANLLRDSQVEFCDGGTFDSCSALPSRCSYKTDLSEEPKSCSSALKTTRPCHNDSDDIKHSDSIKNHCSRYLTAYPVAEPVSQTSQSLHSAQPFNDMYRSPQGFVPVLPYTEYTQSGISDRTGNSFKGHNAYSHQNRQGCCEIHYGGNYNPARDTTRCKTTGKRADASRTDAYIGKIDDQNEDEYSVCSAESTFHMGVKLETRTAEGIKDHTVTKKHQYAPIRKRETDRDYDVYNDQREMTEFPCQREMTEFPCQRDVNIAEPRGGLIHTGDGDVRNELGRACSEIPEEFECLIQEVKTAGEILGKFLLPLQVQREYIEPGDSKQEIFRKLMFLFKQAVPVVIKFMKGLSGFQALDINDRIALTQNSFYSVCILNMARTKPLDITLFNLTTRELPVLLQAFPPMCLFYQHYSSLMYTTQLLRCDSIEYIFLSTIKVTLPDDGTPLQDEASVLSLQRDLMHALHAYEQKNYPDSPERYAVLLLRLAELAFMDTDHLLVIKKIVMENHDITIPQVFSEMFSLYFLAK